MAVDVAQLGIRVESLEADVAAARLDRLSGSAKRAATASERLTASALATSKALKSMGRNMTLYVTTPLLAAAAASAKLGAEFDSTLTKMNTLVGVSREEIKGFRKDILALGPSVGRGPDELANALFAITSAGQRGAQAMDTLKKAAMASAIGLGDTRVVALAATAAVQAYGTANMDSTRALEILIGTIEKGNLEASALAPVLGRVIGIAAELGVEFEDLGAFIATFTLLGVEADEAATSLRGILAAIQKPTPDAEEAFIALGTSIAQVRREIRENGFTATFQDLVNRSRKFGVDLVAIVPNIRALGGALGVFGGEGKIALEVLDGVSAAVGTLGQRFKDMAEQDPSFAFAQMRAELEVMGIQIARDVLPAVLDLVELIKELAEDFSNLDEETQRNIIKWGAFAAAVGPALLVLGSLAGLLGKIIPLLVKLRTGILYLAVLANPLTLIGGAFAGLALIITNEYVNAMIDADSRTEKFISTLGKLNDLKLDMGNLAAINEELAILKEEIDVLALTAEGIDPGTAGSSMHDFAAEDAAERLAPLRAEYEALIRLRDSYIERIKATKDATALEAQEAAYLAEMMQWIAEIDAMEVPEAPAFDTKAFNDLLDALDPSIKALKEYEAAMALLDEAFKSGPPSIRNNVKEYERLKKILQESSLAATAFNRKLSKPKTLSVVTQAELDANFAYLDSLVALEEQLRGLEAQFDPLAGGLKDLADARELAQEGFAQGLLDDTELQRYLDGIDKMESALLDLNDVWRNMLQDSVAALGEVRDLFAKDSAEAEALATVMGVLNVVLGIQAVIKQLAEGDVYSAIPRAIGVAALVASMGVETGAAGGAASTRTRQESQGTGSVLGDTDAKSESILKAMEITASATSELVGINRGMLRALTSLQAGLSGAVVQLARRGDVNIEIPEADTAGLIKLLLPDIGILGGFLRKIFGGKTKLLDTGIQIDGGMLSDLINDVFVQAFADIKSKKWFLGSYKFKTEFAELDDEVGRQFALVFRSIYDTVEQAAIAIGIPLDDIQDRLAAFEVETVKISLQDLNAEEQQEEILAVFSQIFDDLAGTIVPFIGDFQKVGEGLGETLVRVATSVQVMQEAITALGLSVDEMDPEAFARMSVDLVELTGGVEEFISKFTTFFDKFADEGQKLEFITSQVERAFADVGLEVPKTSAGMWELMQTLDATTEEGQAQIAMLLNVSATAAEYYSLLESAEEARLAQVQRLRAFMGDTVFSGLLDLRDDFNAAMKAADDLGASQREYTMIATAFNRRLKRMAAELTISVINLTQQLFGDELVDTVTDGLDQVREVANSVFEDWQRALEDIYDFTQSILLDEQLTTLTPLEQLNEAQSQFDALLAQAMAGDQEAAAGLPAAAQALLEEARFMFASSERYQDIFDRTLAALNNLQMPTGISPTITEDNTPDINVEVVTPEKTANEILAEELQKYLNALDLAGVLRDLSQVLNTSVVGLAASLSVPLQELVTLMGVKLDDITIATATGLGEVAILLGADIFELMEALDIGLGDLLAELPEGIRDDLGPLLEAIKTATTDADVTAGVDNLGEYVLGLPADLQLLLQPFLDWFTQPAEDPGLTSLTGIEFNTAATVDAIHQLGASAVMPGTMGPLMGPINQDGPVVVPPLPPVVVPPVVVPPIIVPPPPPVVMPPIIVPPPTVILPPPTVIPFPYPEPFPVPYPVFGPDRQLQQYADGGSVDRTGPAMLHAGEFVVTKTADNLNVQTGDSGASGDMAQILNVLVDIREQNRRYQEADLATSRDMESSLKTQTEQQRRAANV
jgi:TP901 family phage tail tape measure protein